MSTRAYITINLEFWTKLEELKTALLNFSPESRTINTGQETPQENIDFLKRAINCLDTGREATKQTSELKAALKRVLDATTETQWLLKELNTRTDTPAVAVREILQQMKIMVLNPRNQYYQIEYMAGAVFAKGDKELHFLLSQLRDHCDSQ